jgi:hypothetical protein
VVGGDTDADDRDGEACVSEQEIGGDHLRTGLGRASRLAVDRPPIGGPPNNWQSAFAAVGSAWTFHEATGQYYLHSFMPHQPDLNWDNPEVGAAMHEVLRFWLNRGVDGFRIDAIDAAADLLCYERELDRRFLIALNFSSHRVPLALGDDAHGPATRTSRCADVRASQRGDA